jgi:hypothetical protein
MFSFNAEAQRTQRKAPGSSLCDLRAFCALASNTPINPEPHRGNPTNTKPTPTRSVHPETINDQPSTIKPSPQQTQ